MLLSFDFDYWKELAQVSPEEFERQRRIALDAHIQKVENQRLVALQNRIDLERVRARTPLKSYLRLSSIMYESLFHLGAKLDGCVSKLGYSVKKSSNQSQPLSAKVLPFRLK